MSELRELGVFGASEYVKAEFKKMSLSASAASKEMGVSNSTVSRFLSGNDLTPSLAASLNKAFGFDIELLFKYECARKIHETKSLI